MKSAPALPRIAGHPIHVIRAGAGVRRALFLHCTLCDSGIWAGVQAALLDKLAMTAFDRPGHGRSPEWRGDGLAPGGGEALHRATTRIAARLIDKRADVIGHSYGATVALRLALERPELVRTLTLIEPPLLPLAEGLPGHAAYLHAMAGFGAALDAGDRDEAARIFNDAVNPDAPWASVPEPVRARLAARIHLVADEAAVPMEDAAGLGAPGRLEALSLPVLLIEGSATPPVFAEVQSALAARIPGAQRVIAVGAGHMSPLTHPVNVAGEIAAFLKV